MQIFDADPRVRRGTIANRAMLSVLRGLHGADGETIAKVLADARAEKEAADIALELAKQGTSRDGNGIPAWGVGKAVILPSDLPDNWTASDAAALDHEKVRKAMYGIVNRRDPNVYIGGVNSASGGTPEERFAGWIWSRLYRRDGWSDGNLISSLEGRPDDDEPTYFTSTMGWWSRNQANDPPERRVEVMANPFVLGECPPRRWGSCLADIAGQAVYWGKWATTARADAIKAAGDRVSAADAALKAAEAAARSSGYDPDTGSTGDEAAPPLCSEGYKLDPLTNKCVKEEKSVLPWVIGGAAVVGALLFLRRR
jgi:hypothetical protein